MKKVLIAEDDSYLVNAYRVKLSKAGFAVKMAMDGDEVLQTLQSFSPDLILLDLVMPGKDGFTILAELKKNSSWKGIPVIVSSNLGQKEDREKAMGLGAVDYIVKTEVSLDEVLAKINTVIGKK